MALDITKPMNTQEILQAVSDPVNNALKFIDPLASEALRFAHWANIAGNSIETSYFAGVDARNPSGSTNNIDTVIYKTGETVMLTQEYAYSSTDKIISVVAS